MCANDIAQTLHLLKMIGRKDGKCVLAVDRNAIVEYITRISTSKCPRLAVDEESLRWTPLISNSMLLEEERKTEQEVWYFFCAWSDFSSVGSLCILEIVKCTCNAQKLLAIRH